MSTPIDMSLYQATDDEEFTAPEEDFGPEEDLGWEDEDEGEGDVYADWDEDGLEGRGDEIEEFPYGEPSD